MYCKTRQISCYRSKAIALLKKYDKKEPPPTEASEGTVFAQMGEKKDKNKGDDKTKPSDNKQEKKDKTFFKDEECFVCGKKGHGAKSCPNKKKSKRKGDDSTTLSKLSKIEELERKIKSANKQFTQLRHSMLPMTHVLPQKYGVWTYHH